MPLSPDTPSLRAWIGLYVLAFLITETLGASGAVYLYGFTAETAKVMALILGLGALGTILAIPVNNQIWKRVTRRLVRRRQ